MANQDQHDITELLRQAADGHDDALERVIQQVYEDLRRVAHRRMQQKYGRGYRDQTLEPTALVHETFMRLREQRSEFKNRRHFFAVATRVMMRALIDFQRAKLSKKRGGDQLRVTLSRFHNEPNPASPIDMATFSKLLDQLETQDERKVEVVRLYVLWGFEMAEISEILDVSVRTVERDWKFARAWLADRLDAET